MSLATVTSAQVVVKSIPHVHNCPIMGMMPTVFNLYHEENSQKLQNNQVLALYSFFKG